MKNCDIVPAIEGAGNRHCPPASPVVYCSRLERFSGATCRSHPAAVWRLSRGVRVCLLLCLSGSTGLSARYSTLFHSEYLSQCFDFVLHPELNQLVNFHEDCPHESNEIAPRSKDAGFVYLSTLTLSARLSQALQSKFWICLCYQCNYGLIIYVKITRGRVSMSFPIVIKLFEIHQCASNYCQYY